MANQQVLYQESLLSDFVLNPSIQSKERKKTVQQSVSTQEKPRQASSWPGILLCCLTVGEATEWLSEPIDSSVHTAVSFVAARYVFLRVGPYLMPGHVNMTVKVKDHVP